MEVCKELNKVIKKMKDEIEDEQKQEPLAIKVPLAPSKPVENAIVPISNQNVEGNIVPFEPNWVDEPDFNLMVIVTKLEGQEYQIQSNTSYNRNWFNSIICQCLLGARLEI